jgi:uncharacterized protein
MARARKTARRTAGRKREAARTARARPRSRQVAEEPGVPPSSEEKASPEHAAPTEREAADRAGSERRAVSAAPRAVVGYQRWDDLLMLHWEVAPDALRPLVPEPLELDLFGGRAFVSLTPFTMIGARLRGLPPLPLIGQFHELNLRTYVSVDGVPGLWFLSLDAASAPAAAIARATLGLPYFRARMERGTQGRAHEFRSVRLLPSRASASFAARWSVGAIVPDPPGSLSGFLAERYALYSRHGGRTLRVRVRHPRWVLHETALEHVEQDVTRAAGLAVPGPPLLSRFSRGVDVEVFAPEVLG